MNNNIASYIGLAQKANDVIYGEDQIKEKIKSIFLILVDTNANIKFKERVKIKFQNKDLYEIENLKEFLHKDNVKIIGIKNEELSKVIKNILR